jgi:hypothetical protein
MEKEKHKRGFEYVCDVGKSYATLRDNMSSVTKKITQSAPKHTGDILYYLVSREQWENRYWNRYDDFKPVESTYKEIAKKCYINGISGVQRCLIWLKENGWLTMVQGANRYKPTRFYIEIKRINDFIREIESEPKISNAEKRNQYKFFECLIDSLPYSDLTDIEYAVALIWDNIDDRTKAGKINPNKICKQEYGELLETVSKESSVPINDLKELFRSFKVKGNKVHIDFQQISIEQIFQYNHNHNEESKIVQKWKERIDKNKK